MVVQTVQHILYPPQELPEWPDADRRSRLVFICRGVPASTMASIRHSLLETVYPDSQR